MRDFVAPEQIPELSRQTLELLHRHGALPSPENYVLWFAYAAQDDEELTTALDQAVKEGKAADAAHARFLHARFFGPGTSEALEEVGSQLTQEVGKLAQVLEAAGADARDYGKALKVAGDELDRGEIGPQLKTILSKVTAATRAMEARNKALEMQLNSSIGEVHTLRERMETVRQESLSDALTGLANRRCFDERIRQAAGEAAAENKPLCIAIGDVDHFKRFNDTWGHPVGDQVLRLVAQCFKSNVKGRDTAARFGGEEFVVILPETVLTDAATIANHIRRSVESKKIVNRASGQNLGSITLSLGVAQFAPGEAIADLIARADACLYAAKHAGRNRVLSERDVAGSEVKPSIAQKKAAAPAASAAVPPRSKESLEFEHAVRALGRPGSLPSRSDIDLRHFQRFARWMVIAEPQTDAQKILMRLVGSGFFEFLGRDLTDTDYLELADPAIRATAHAGALAMINHPCGLWQQTPISPVAAGPTMLFEYTAFPILDERRGVRQMLAFANHNFSAFTGFPRSSQIQKTTVWQWIDVGHGVPDAVASGAAA